MSSIASITPLDSTSIVPARLRITRRGRLVVTSILVAPALAALGLWGVGVSGATATSELSSQEFTYISAHPGDSLWGIAERVAPQSDPRDVIHDLMVFNGMTTSDLAAGQQVAIPASYDY